MVSRYQGNPKEVSNDNEFFSHVARIPDAMLKKVDPTNVVLIDYMTTIDSKVETGKLLTKEGVGHSKKSKTTKKGVIVNPELNFHETKQSKSPKKTTKPDELVSKVVIKPVEPFVIKPTSVTIPSKTGVFQILKLKYGSSPTSNVVRKPHITHQGTVIIPPEVSSAKSSHEEVRTSNITTNVSDTDVNVIMGEGDLSNNSTSTRLRIENPREGRSCGSDIRVEDKFIQFKVCGSCEKLNNIQKEGHTLFVMGVKKVREDVNLKLQVLFYDTVREVAVVQKDDANLLWGGYFDAQRFEGVAA
ncbi:unnamed protein product [Lactuca saligna]|uniref:Uncharacterized protein n=1 Tax=Lactuca saligna TaxID=75948 RepID=A0AA36EBZ4_LACSI|nr:unnamed protein product [Lactuca saligna]